MCGRMKSGFTTVRLCPNSSGPGDGARRKQKAGGKRIVEQIRNRGAAAVERSDQRRGGVEAGALDVVVARDSGNSGPSRRAPRAFR